MKLLAFETSAKAVSVALAEDGRLVGEYYQNSGQTHSRTLMKLAEDLLDNCDCKVEEIDAVAYANGPGSFTGVRIGVAAAKGFCWGLDIPCLPVSTLEGMAWSHLDANGIVCCCMDARRVQVYNALFRVSGGTVTRLREDRAISLSELSDDLQGLGEPILLVGDGALLTWNTLHDRAPGLVLSAEALRQQRASGVALAGFSLAQTGKAVSAAIPAPNYLRLSQAERERLSREITAKGE